uniref:Galactosylgalactosylxylosylprotein 3-beta-glucuronosyltransferase n=1 Tax=Cacopsylla melanoneura TaxID=428564 RepID=A0A8D8YIM4_9HEMI
MEKKDMKIFTHMKKMFLVVVCLSIIIVYLMWTSQGKHIVVSSFMKLDQTNDPITCTTSFKDLRIFHNVNKDLPTIYFVTPTYPRREQVAELTRLGQTLMHIPALHWIVADDTPECSPMISALLPKFGIPYTHISSPMPQIYRSNNAIPPRGVSNRRAALAWIRTFIKTGVVYFGDDDNTFDLKLFDEIRGTKKISMFPVGLIGSYGISSPVLRKGNVIGFFDSWPAKRKFPVDMAGFAVNVDLILKHPNATMPYKAGYEEDRFISSLGVKMSDIEPKANNCSEILVWHTQTLKKPPPTVKVTMELLSIVDTSLVKLFEELKFLGMGSMSTHEGTKSYLTKDGKMYRL